MAQEWANERRMIQAKRRGLKSRHIQSFTTYSISISHLVNYKLHIKIIVDLPLFFLNSLENALHHKNYSSISSEISQENKIRGDA